jgi:HK97 family phage major capsid protein
MEKRMKKKMRSCERKSLARAYQTFSAPKTLAAIVHDFASMVAPAFIVVALFGAAAFASSHATGSHHFLDTGMLMGSVAVRQSTQLKEQRMKLVSDCRAILDTAEKEKRKLSASELETYNKMDKDVDSLTEDIVRHERQEARELEMNARDPKAPTVAVADPGGSQPKGFRHSKEYQAAFSEFLKNGKMDAKFSAALQQDSDTAGGFTVVPQQFATDLIKFLDDQVFVRSMATKVQVDKAESLGAASLDADPADADWTSEIATGSEDSTMKFGKRELRPHPLAKRIKVSNKLIRISALPVDNIVLKRLGYKFAISEEKAFILGTGAQQPLGLMVADASGISTARDIATGNTTTAIGADGLIEAKYKLKAQYRGRPSTAWLFHRDAVKSIRKLKDNNNQYLWAPAMGSAFASLAFGNPDRILDIPFYESEYMPNTFTTGKYVGIIGDFSFYWIADALNIAIQRLNELYAETNQTGFIARQEVDGMPVLEEAFARVTLA